MVLHEPRCLHCYLFPLPLFTSPSASAVEEVADTSLLGVGAEEETKLQGAWGGQVPLAPGSPGPARGRQWVWVGGLEPFDQGARQAFGSGPSHVPR